MSIWSNNEEQREFLGTTPPSLIACGSFLVGSAGCGLAVLHLGFLVLAGLGLIGVLVGVHLNLRRGLSVKWRKTNVVFHLLFAAAILAGTVTVLWIRIA